MSPLSVESLNEDDAGSHDDQHEKVMVQSSPSLESRPLPYPQHWMYCITSMQKEGSGYSCTFFMFSRGICIEPMGCEMSCDF